MKEKYEILLAKQRRIVAAMQALAAQAERNMNDIYAELELDIPGKKSVDIPVVNELPKVEILDLEKTKTPKEYFNQKVEDTRWGNEILVALGLDEIKGIHSIVINRAFIVNEGQEKVFCDLGSKNRKPYYICSLLNKDGDIMSGWWQTSKGKTKDGKSRGKELGKKFQMETLESHTELMGILVEHHYNAIDKERDWMPCTIEFAI